MIFFAFRVLAYYEEQSKAIATIMSIGQYHAIMRMILLLLLLLMMMVITTSMLQSILATTSETTIMI